MDKATAIDLLMQQIKAGKALQTSAGGDTSKWQLDCTACLERVFGAGSRQLVTFQSVRWLPPPIWVNWPNTEPYRSAHLQGLRNSIAVLESAADEVRQFWELDRAGVGPDPFQRIERVCHQFHFIARQLRKRHENRPTLNVVDEYDVQDLIHALLILDFDDVRPEEWAPSYAAASSRMDFLLKREQIVLETKRTRAGLTAKKVGDELLVDCQRYKTHPDCKMLVCFIYDPEGLIGNPRGLENDLGTAGGELPVKVYIRP